MFMAYSMSSARSPAAARTSPIISRVSSQVASGPLASVAVSQLDELTHRAVLSWLDYRRTRWLVGSSVVEDRQIELAEAVGVGEPRRSRRSSRA
jgi:hypothetical protein